RPELAQVKLLNGEALPFLDEVLTKLLPRIEINIEIKGPSEELAAAVARVAGDHPHRAGIVISSFCWQPLVWMKNNCQDLRRACLWSSDSLSWPFFANMAPQIFLDRCGTNILHPHVDLVN